MELKLNFIDFKVVQLECKCYTSLVPSYLQIKNKEFVLRK